MASGFSFGANTTATPAFGSTTLTFGGAPASQPQPTLSFGTPAATPGGTTSLFATPASVPGSTPSLFSTPGQTTGLFSTPASTSAAPNVSFGAATSSAPTFGAPAAPPSHSCVSFNMPVSSAAPTFLLSGQPATTTSLLNLGSGLGVSTAATSTPSLGSTPASTTTATLTFGLGGGLAPTTTTTSATLATTTPSVGLGGVPSSTQGKGSTVTAQKEVAPKDQPLPNEILQTVEAFKVMVKQQKSHSSDISRCSIRDFRRVEQEIKQISNQLNEIENQLQKNRHIAEKLKYDTAKTLQNVEIAQRTHDTPPGLQYENTAPLKFFMGLADQFERDMQNLKMQIEAADKFVKNHKNPDSLTPQDLAMGMRRLHETFVALAGRLQSVHSEVDAQKETYLNIRKHLLQDTTNPFDQLQKMPNFDVANVQGNSLHSPPKVATGPTPFNNNSALRTMTAGTPQPSSAPPPAYPGTSGGPSGFGSSGFGASLSGLQPSNTSLFGQTLGNTSFNSSFQLQKPPTGNKRGKV